MNRKLFVQAALLLASVRVLLAAEPLAQGDDGWTIAKTTAGLTLYSRIRPGSSLKEYKAIGGIDAPTTAVHQVLNDVDSYPVFMPFVTECRIVKREGSATFTYQRLSPKICSDRDYTLRIDQKSWASEGGMAFLNRWQPANDVGPPQKKGVIRVSVCEGSWLLEPTAEKQTRATYRVFSDSGGSLPAFISNPANEMAIRRVFAGIRRQVTLPKYAHE
ncbi:MAG TPA: SRPBCC family protein [Chthoniobacterales bacterium]|jgi:hypothetical protein